MEKQDIKGSAQ